MKKTLIVFLALCFAVSCYAGERSLYEKFKNKPHIKVCLKEVTNEVEDPNVKVNEFKSIFADTHRKRIDIKFVPVDSADKADVIVTAKIKSYVFTEKALPSIFGVATLAADTLAPKSSAKLVVDYTLTDGKTGKVLTEYGNFTTETRRPVETMKEGDKAFRFAATENVSRFIYKTFRKQKEKAHEVME